LQLLLTTSKVHADDQTEYAKCINKLNEILGSNNLEYRLAAATYKNYAKDLEKVALAVREKKWDDGGGKKRAWQDKNGVSGLSVLLAQSEDEWPVILEMADLPGRCLIALRLFSKPDAQLVALQQVDESPTDDLPGPSQQAPIDKPRHRPPAKRRRTETLNPPVLNTAFNDRRQQ